MKKLTQASLMAILLLSLLGCSSNALLNNEQLDPLLPKVNEVKAIPNHTSVAFEWKSLASKGITGYNIYRADTNTYLRSPQLTKIGSIRNRFSTHYVDTKLRQGTGYTYTFTAVKNGFESSNGKVMSVKTLPAFNAVTFFQGFQKTATNIKLIWRPHSNLKVSWYRVERKMNGGEWMWIGTVKERMMAEYIDTNIIAGNRYDYRVIAIGFEHSFSQPSSTVSIVAR